MRPQDDVGHICTFLANRVVDGLVRVRSAQTGVARLVFIARVCRPMRLAQRAACVACSVLGLVVVSRRLYVTRYG